MTHAVSLFTFLFGSGVADAFSSPFIVPVAGTVMVLGIVVAGIWSGVRHQEMRSQERLAAIAKGLPLPPTLEEQALMKASGLVETNTLERQRNASRRAGLVLVFTGVGLVAFFVMLTAVLHVREILCGAAAGLIPVGIGIGFLVDAKIRTRDIESKGFGPGHSAGVSSAPLS